MLDSPRYFLRVDSFSLLIDGGEGSDFAASLGAPTGAGSSTKIPVTAQGSDAGHTVRVFHTAVNGDGRSVAYYASGTSSGSYNGTVNLSVGSLPDGEYTVYSVLYRESTGYDDNPLTVVSNVFRVINGRAIVSPRLDVVLDPAVRTNTNVTATFTAEDVNNRYRDITLTGLNFSLAEADDGAYTATFAENIDAVIRMNFTDVLTGTTYETQETVVIDLIDKAPPEIEYAPIALSAGTGRAEAEAAFAAALTVTDDNTFTVSYTISDEVIALGGDVTVTAEDMLGNRASKECGVTILTEPPVLSLESGYSAAGTTATLSGAVESVGGRTLDEVGFVYGTMRSPTYDTNNGLIVLGGSVSSATMYPAVTAENLAEGVQYYGRLYGTAGGQTYYGNTVAFGIGVPEYGAFTVAAGSGAGTFVISRTGTAGTQTVYYRTVNGSAIGGTHFDHTDGTLMFAEGESTKTVTVTEHTSAAQYGSYASTQFSNADRTYALEIYRVEGGATIDTGSASRTIAADSAYTVDRNIFNTFTAVNGQQGEWTHGDSDRDGLGWYNGKEGSAGRETIDKSASYYSAQRAYWTNVGSNLLYYVSMEIREVDDGYQTIQINPGNGLDLTIQANGSSLESYGSNTHSAAYVVMFEHGGSRKETDWSSYTFPLPSTAQRTNIFTNGEYIQPSDATQISFPVGQTHVSLGFTASGTGNDKWNSRDIQHHFKVSDTRGPQYIGLAPMAGGTYLKGDTITVALVFDEIIDSANSPEIGSVSVRLTSGGTALGTLSYAGGADTNVLYFTGTLDVDAAIDNTNTSISAELLNGTNLHDMAGNAFTSGAAQSGSIDLDTREATVNIESPTSGTLPVHSATITATGAARIMYAWTQSAAMPASGWIDTTSGAAVTGRQETGIWYLHALAEHENGSAAHTYRQFTFLQPELRVTVTGSGWTKAKTLSVTASGTTGTYTLSYVCPGNAAIETGEYSSAQTAEHTVTTAGTYTVTLTDGYQNVLSETVTVSQIDGVLPAIDISGPNTDAVYNELTLYVSASDTGGSGIATLQYAFTDTADTPQSGWTTVPDAADGQPYEWSYAATEAAETNKYLHVRLTDGAGNTAEAVSAAYTVVRTPTAAAPSISVTEPSGSDWTTSVTLDWSVEVHTDTYLVYAASAGADEPLQNQSGGQVTITKNGAYTFMVTDANGQSAYETVVVNTIDTEAPELTGLSVSGHTVTLTGVTDALTARYGADGEISDYSGSGGIKRSYALSGSDAFTEFSGDTFTAPAYGSYIVRLTDAMGNVSDYEVLVHNHAYRDGGDSVDYLPLTVTAGELNGGHYFLNGSLTLTDTVTIPAGETVVLCLNGCTLTLGDELAVSGTLILCDCAAGGAIAAPSGASLTVERGGVVEMYAGSLTADAEMVIDDGTFRLYGGTIDGRTIGLRTELTVQDGEVYLYGGTIGREIALSGGALYLSGAPEINSVSIEAVGYAVVYAAADGAPYTGGTVDIDYTIPRDAREGTDIVLGLSDSNRDKFDITLRDDSERIFQVENVLVTVLAVAVVLLGLYTIRLYLPKKRMAAAETAASTDDTTDTARLPVNLPEAVVAPAADAPIAVPAAYPAPAVSDRAVVVTADGRRIIVRYNRSFVAKLIQCDDAVKAYYVDIANRLRGYEKVNNRISWKYSSFRAGRRPFALMAVNGKTLCLYLALDPASDEAVKFRLRDVSAKKQYAAFPAMLKIRSALSVRRALLLIDGLADRLGLTVRGKNVRAVDPGAFAYDTTDNLIARGLIRIKAVHGNPIGAHDTLVAAGYEPRKSITVAEARTLLTDKDAEDLVEKLPEKNAGPARRAARTGRKFPVNVDVLNARFADGDTVDIAALKAGRLVPARETAVKILARGTLSKSLTVIADAFSADAVKMIVLTGGRAVRCDTPVGSDDR